MLTKGRTTGLLVAALFACSSPAWAQTTLQYKFKKGDKTSYVMEQKMAMKMNVGGMDIQMDMLQTIDMTQTVNDVDAKGNANVTMKFERWRMNMDGPTGKVEVDSEKGGAADNPVAQALAPFVTAMKGAEFNVTMSPQGEQSNVKIPASFLKALKANPIPGMQDMFSEESMKRMMTQSGQVLPKGPISKGATWENKAEMKMPFGTMKTKTSNTYEGPVNNLEKIAFKIEMSLDPDPNAPFQVKMKVDDAKGAALFDNNAGRLVEVSATQNMNMEISAGGMNINQRIESVMTMKLKK